MIIPLSLRLSGIEFSLVSMLVYLSVPLRVSIEYVYFHVFFTGKSVLTEIEARDGKYLKSF
jgi:hypothetical protein